MALLGQGALIIWHAMTEEADQEMIRWHNREHVLERVSIPGFLRGRRYDTAGRPRTYLDLYETETVETVRSAPYVLRLNFPTPWTQRVLPHFRDTERLGCRVAATSGRGQGGALVTVRMRPAAGQAGRLRAWLEGPGASALGEPAAAVGVHLLETVAETTRVKTAEGKLKGGEVKAGEEPWPLVLLAEVSDAETAEGFAKSALHPDALVGHGAEHGALVRVHRLQLSMDQP
jgi:hypothetical protein